MMRSLLRNRKGLTLIELIVVVAIIAVLAFTITPRVLTALNTSRTSSARSLANELHAAMERYYADQGTGSTGVATYVRLTGSPSGVTTWEDLRAGLGSTLALSNTDNLWSGTFTYWAYSSATPANANRIAVGATTTALSYCIHFDGKDNPATVFRITPTGVLEGTAATACE